MATLPTDYNELKAMAAAHGYKGESQKKADLIVFLESINASLPEDENILPPTDLSPADLLPEDEEAPKIPMTEDEFKASQIGVGKTVKIKLKEKVLGLGEKGATIEVAESALKDIPEAWYE